MAKLPLLIASFHFQIYIIDIVEKNTADACENKSNSEDKISTTGESQQASTNVEEGDPKTVRVQIIEEDTDKTQIPNN